MVLALARKLLIIAAGIALIAPLAACTKEQAAPVPAAASALRPGDVAFPGMQLRPGGSPTAFILIGRIKNRAAQGTLTEVQLRLAMEDVLASGTSTTVAETVVTVRREVAPAQSVEFEEKVEFGKLPKPRGRHEWNYSVVTIKSK